MRHNAIYEWQVFCFYREFTENYFKNTISLTLLDILTEAIFFKRIIILHHIIIINNNFE